MGGEWKRGFGRAAIGVVGLLGVLSAGVTPAAGAQWGDAIPGSEGFGSKTSGGRGGAVLIVDNLEDLVGHPPVGSLRWAVSQTGPRIVVFRVAGTIELLGKLLITNPNLTIAGQTAPGGGITIKDYPLKVNTHDVILQGVRVRLGAGVLDNSDAFAISGPETHDVIVDHCSFSWSTDEVASAGDGAYDLTFQNTIFSEGLDCSLHPEGCHSRGMLTTAGVRRITFRRNYFAHNDFRNPKLFGEAGLLGGMTATFDFYNNVIYNWRSWAVAGAGRSRVNVERNSFKLGPSSSGYPDNLEIHSTDETQGYRLWVEGNVGPSCPTGCADDWEDMVSSTDDQYRAPRANRTPPALILSAGDSRALVMPEVGASYRLNNDGLRVPRRDGVDARVVGDFASGTGGLIDDPSEVGGWPVLSAGTPVVDSDLDGMPDAWELANGLDPFDSTDAAENPDGDPYTNIEEYLFEIDPGVAESKRGSHARRAGKSARSRPVERPSVRRHRRTVRESE